ncbi:MAG TPA: glutaminyl-peptide cyclotransferase [Kiritimatiellia bacterium]|nr:glutaminyl-peptide cyclotransferase [Kiritimatiellia bacterium]
MKKPPAHSLFKALLRLAIASVTLLAACKDAPVAPDLKERFELVATYPTDPTAYTQGLLFHNGFLYESTGLYGQSSLRKVELETGRVIKRRMLPPQYFGEGLTVYSNRLYQLTWMEEVVLVYDLETLAFLGTFPFEGEGWGVTTLNGELVVSDGTDSLRFYDPASMQRIRRLSVTEQGRPLFRLNELEAIDGQIYAHLFMTDDLVRIDPVTGEVTGRWSFPDLHPSALRSSVEEVFNGIAYDVETGRIFMTGKNWPHLFEFKKVRAITR